jgi:hypothetical protein
MKKILTIIAIACIAFATPSQAQVKFGLKGGLNLTSLSADNIAGGVSNKSGFFVGPTVKFTLPVVGLSLDASALYDQRNAKIKNADATVKFQSVQIPINVRYGFGLSSVVNVFAFAGPQFGFKLGGDKTWDQVAEWTLKSSNLSANVGIGATVAGHLQAKLNYNFALGKTGDVDAWDAVKNTYENVGNAKFSAWQISLAWFF